MAVALCLGWNLEIPTYPSAMQQQWQAALLSRGFLPYVRIDAKSFVSPIVILHPLPSDRNIGDAQRSADKRRFLGLGTICNLRIRAQPQWY